MAYLQIAVELAKAVAWPAAIVWVGWYFRAPIIEQLPRVTKVGPVNLDPAKQVAVPPPTSLVGDHPFKRLEAMMLPELLAETRQLIESNLSKGAGGQLVDHTEYLLQLASTLTLAGLFEKTNGVIWGSQIALLQQVNVAPQPLAWARAIYDQAASSFSSVYEHYSFDQWIGFLETSVLVSRHPNEMLHITTRGRAFLGYVVQNGYPLFRSN